MTDYGEIRAWTLDGGRPCPARESDVAASVRHRICDAVDAPLVPVPPADPRHDRER